MRKSYTTIPDVLATLKRHKPMSRETLYCYLRKLGIKPIGALRQRPQLYPADTAKRVLSGLGLS